ncbi:MAG: ATP-binding protein [Candidatus Micrarchaeota archaeon]
MINSINLKNWRSHSDSLFEFREGTNLFIGMMGSGKSTILDGISFALFGTFPALERRKLKLEHIIRLNEDHANIVIEFLWNNENYKIERKIEKGKSLTSTNALIYKNSQLMEKGSKAVTKYVEDLLQVDYNLFTRAIYSEQNNIDYFLTLDPSKRKIEMDFLLGLDKFETARSNIVSVINRLKSNQSFLESKWNSETYQSLLKSRLEKEQEVVKTTSDFERASKVLVAHKTEASRLVAEFSEMKKTKDEYEQLSKEKIKRQAIIESLEKEINGKEANLEVYENLKKSKSDIEKSRESYLAKLRDIAKHESNVSKETGVLDTRIKTAEKVNAELKIIEVKVAAESLEDLVNLHKELENSSISAKSEKKSLEHQLLELQDSSEKLKPGSSICPVCESELNEDKIQHLKIHKDQKIAETKEALHKLNSELPQKSKQLEELSRKIKTLELLANRFNILKAEATDVSKLIAEKEDRGRALICLGNERLQIEKDISELNNRVQMLVLEMSDIEKLINKKQKLSLEKMSLDDIILSLGKIQFDESKFEKLRTALESVRIEIEKTNSLVSNSLSRQKMASDVLALILKDIKGQEDIKTELESLRKMIEDLSLYRTALIETQTNLRSSLIEAINSAMNEIWTIFYPYKDYSALRLSAGEKDYQFEIMSDSWKTLESVASGGERACAALTLRVALAMVLTPNLSWLILDEPTHNLDKEAVELLSQTLQYKVPEVVKQTFVITHDESLMGSEFASSYKLNRDKGNFGATSVERI